MMSGPKASDYFKATGFSPYYFANVIYNVVKSPGPFMRNIEDILGDAQSVGLCQPFSRYSNLHRFIGQLVDGLFFERPNEGLNYMIYDFLVHIGRHSEVSCKDDLDELVESQDGEAYNKAYFDLIDEIFHILFLNIAFLKNFNELTAIYIVFCGEGGLCPNLFTSRGRLRRVNIPAFARDAVYFRDQGECRRCKEAIDRRLSPAKKERYDHIVSLSSGGGNDISNLQLLCERCNREKSDKDIAVSDLYRKLYDNDV